MSPKRNPFDRIREIIENMPNSPAGGFGERSTTNNFVEQSVDSEKGVLSVVMDIPGASEEDIEATVAERGNRQFLVVTAETQTESMRRKYREQVGLTARVDPDLGDAQYNNGVLTIEFPIVDDNSNGVTIDIQ